MHSLYLAMQTKSEILLLVFDTVGPSAKNVALVRDLFGSMNPDILNEMYRAGAAARSEK
jgi:hypothetical protein